MKEIVKKFAEEMEKVLDEKFEKYQDSWKDENLSELKKSLDKQKRKLTLAFDNNYYYKDKEETKRTLINIANYCLFIFTGLD